MYGIEITELNLAAVFGVFVGIYILTSFDVVVRESLTFVKGWRSQ